MATGGLALLISPGSQPHRFTGLETIGMVSLKQGYSVPVHATINKTTNPSQGLLRLEVGYGFIKAGWGKGYATEACRALLDTARECKSFFEPFTKVWVEAAVSPTHEGSKRVLVKSGLDLIGVNEWESDPVWLAGDWQAPKVLIYGGWLLQ